MATHLKATVPLAVKALHYDPKTGDVRRLERGSHDAFKGYPLILTIGDAHYIIQGRGTDGPGSGAASHAEPQFSVGGYLWSGPVLLTVPDATPHVELPTPEAFRATIKPLPPPLAPPSESS